MKLAPIYHWVLIMYFLCFSVCIYTLAQSHILSGTAINAVNHLTLRSAL
jgi:hypothetical protein